MPGFVLFLLAYWYLVYYIRLVLCYSYLPIGTWYIYAWFCAILTCLLVLGIYTPGFVLFLLAYWYLVYIRLVLCYSYLRIRTCIYTPGFVLFLLAYWYLILCVNYSCRQVDTYEKSLQRQDKSCGHLIGGNRSVRVCLSTYRSFRVRTYFLYRKTKV